jgi:hypothetical protein
MGAIRRRAALFATWAIPAAVAVTMTSACVYASKVTVAGREAFRVHCQAEPQCVEKSGEVCAGAYEVLSSSVQQDGFVNNGTGYANAPIELIIACKGTAPTGLPASKGSPVSPGSPAGAPTEPSSCVAAAATLKETASFWAELHPDAKRLEELPPARDFSEVCRALPERVQRCLDARYRGAHDKPCLALLKRLDPSERNKIDALFLE